MKIEVHTMVWREPRLRLFLNHYTKFADRVVLWLYGNDPQDRATAESFPGVTLREFYPVEDGLMIYYWTEMRSWWWKNTDADWIMLPDGDELIYHPRMREYLETCPHSILKLQGFECVGPETTSLDKGLNSWSVTPRNSFDKCLVVRACENMDTCWENGAHDLVPPARGTEAPVLLLHTRYIGLPEHSFARSEELLRAQASFETNAYSRSFTDHLDNRTTFKRTWTYMMAGKPLKAVVGSPSRNWEV